MYVHFVRVHAKSVVVAQEICREFGHLLPLFQEPGWLGGACLQNTADECDVIVYGQWASPAAARAWLDSETCRLGMQQLSSNINGSPEIATFEGHTV